MRRSSAGEGEVLVKNEWLSLDPYMRGRMNDAKSYVPPVQIGEVMVGQTVARSSSRAMHALRQATRCSRLRLATLRHDQGCELTKVDTRQAPASYYLGLLGMPGFTAWFGLLEIGKPKPGETSSCRRPPAPSAASSGNWQKLHGCRVVGIAGGAAKCDYVVNELGFDACVDHRRGSLHDDLRVPVRTASTSISRASAVPSSTRCSR
jgi:NADPH-dependent curcumin reductase CurA